MGKDLSLFDYVCRTDDLFRCLWLPNGVFNSTKQKPLKPMTNNELTEIDILIEDSNAQWKKIPMDKIGLVNVRGAILSDEHRRNIPPQYLERFRFACAKNLDHAEKYRSILPIHWLPNCAEEHPELTPKNYSESERIYDVSFIGSRVIGRKTLIPEVIDELQKKKIKTFIHLGNRMPYLDMMKIYQQSKIVINESTKNLDLNLRVFEGMYAGALMITNMCGNGIDRIFSHEHLVYYKDKQDFIDKIYYYLGEEHETEKIASSGFKEVCSKHLRKNRINQLVEYIRLYV